MSMIFTSIIRRKQTMRFLLAASSIAWLLTDANAETFNCPAYIAASSANVVEVPPSWKVNGQSNKLKVVSAGFSDGQPSELAYLKPYETRRKGGSTVAIWKFEGLYPKGKWLSCDYEGGLVSLTREMPTGISECVVIYEKPRSGSAQPGPIACK
jgi:hypothetical protein